MSVYSRYKIFHYKDKLDSLSRSSEMILPPIHIRIKPTNVCNHNCHYCAYRKEDLQLGQDMNVRDYIAREKMMEIIDDLIEMDVKAVTFSGGGEPFCYPYLLDAAKKLADSPISFAALTNGAQLRGEIAEIFAHHATWLRVSIDGWDAKSYARYRGVSDVEFEKVCGNMRSFKECKGPCFLGVSIIVDKNNAKHLHDMVSLFKELGVDSVKISPCIVSNSGKETNDYHAPIYACVKEEIDSIKCDFSSDAFDICDAYHMQLETFQKEYKWCPYQQILPVIGADCNIYPCQDKAYNVEAGLLGSIKGQRFRDFWFHNKDVFFEINPLRVCNHHCVADGKNKQILDYVNVKKAHLAFV